MGSSSSTTTTLTIRPSMAWLFLFLPSLSYYVGTRLHSLGLFRSSSYGTVITSTISILNDGSEESSSLACTELSKRLPLKDCNTQSEVATLKYPIYLVQEDLGGVVDTCWRHDSELGRGFLLLSTSEEKGHIFRWETGGGPIAIGRTLSVKDSGCRSNHHRDCSTSGSQERGLVGSGGIAIDFSKHDDFHEGSLLVAEWGEGRIVRMDENGARTPLILEAPNTCQGEDETEPSNKTHRLNQPHTLAMTPFGDLLALDCFDCGCAVLQLKQAHAVPPLESLSESRKAHAWSQIEGVSLPDILYSTEDLGGMTLDKNWMNLLVTAKQDDGSVVVARLSLDDEDHVDEEDKLKTVLNISSHTQKPGPIAVDKEGTMFIGVESSVLIAAEDGILAKIDLPKEEGEDGSGSSPTALTLGEDKMLYISTQSKLYRVWLNTVPVKVPTNLILKK